MAVGDATPAVKAPKSGGTCLERQSVTLAASDGWRCVVSMTPEQALLVRVEQRDVDVVVRLTGPKSEEIVAVDAPTKRASPELALLGPQLAGTHVLVIRPTDPATNATGVEVSLNRLQGGEATGLARALMMMTLSATPVEKPTAETAQRSITRLRDALEQVQAAGAKEYEAEVLLRIAALYYWTINDWANAAIAASNASAAAARALDPVMQSQAAMIRAASLLEIANAMKQPGRRTGAHPEQTQFDEAMVLLAAAADVFQQEMRPFDQAQAINYLGIALFYQGQYSDARARFQQAARTYRALGERTSEALPLQNIAMIDYDGGDYSRAIGSYQSLLKVLSPVNDAGYYMSVLLNLGNAQYVMGDFERALHSFMTALQLSEEKSFVAEQARSLHGLGLVYLAIGERERAEVFLERALTLRRSIAKQDPRGLQTSRLWVGDLKRENGDVREALALHVEALDNALTVTQKARALYSIGRDHESQDDPAAAMQAYTSALKLELPEDWPVRVSVLGSYGRAMLHSGDSTGREYVLKAARLHETRGDDDLAAQGYFTLALDDRDRGQLNASVANTEKALALFESQRLRAVNPDLRATYLGNRAAVFETQTDLYTTLWRQAADKKEKERLQNRALSTLAAKRQQVLDDFRELARPLRAGDDAAAADDVTVLDGLIAAKRHRLAVIMEQPTPSPEKIESLRKDISVLRTRLDLAHASSGTAAGSSSKTTGSAQALRPIQSTLDRDAVLLVYQLGENRSWVWAVTREAAVAFELAPRAEIERIARLLYATWSSPGADPASHSLEMAASRQILGPVAELLEDKATVLIAADGILRSVPFGALWMDGAGSTPPRRLMETHAVALRASLGDSAPAAGETRGGANNRILLIGDPTVAKSAGESRPQLQADPWSWEPLPGTRREVQAIADIAADWRSYVLLGSEATKSALLSMPLDTFRAIHFATHARLDVQDPQLSAIALSSRDATFASSGSTLSVREILGFKLTAETVVLSACEASLGKEYRGQLSFGLSEAFLLAGARNVLGSLWRVSDEGAQEYMRHFYEQYVRHDASPAAAAQAAARTMARDPAFKHPYFWAAFVVNER